MRILVLGGYGLIGSAVVAHCLRAGHEVTGLGRDVSVARRRAPTATWIARDIALMTAPEDWDALVGAVDAVVNCSGALQDGARDDVRAVQSVAMRALFASCHRLRVGRIVQISATGATDGAPTAFMRTKAEADTVLRSLDLDWVILRPGLVLAPVAYGATGLLRALASLPVATLAPSGLRPIQTVHVDDVARGVLLAIEGRIPLRASYDLVEDDAHTLPAIVAAFRAWLGHSPARRCIPVPARLLRASFRVGDVLGRLGWRSPMRTTALRQIEAGVAGDPSDWTRVTGVALSGLTQSLARIPSGVQERWFGRLWLLKPAVVATLSLFWLTSGMVALARLDAATAVMTTHGVSAFLAMATVLSGILLDLGLGSAILVRRTMPWAALGMVATTGAYLAAGTVLAPGLWLDPLGVYVKTIPGAMLALIAYALADER